MLHHSRRFSGAGVVKVPPQRDSTSLRLVSYWNFGSDFTAKEGGASYVAAASITVAARELKTGLGTASSSPSTPTLVAAPTPLTLTAYRRAS